jgi:hypothetical protein
MLTGVSPSIADTVVQMGIDLRGIDTYRTLREALTAYVDGKARAGERQGRRAPLPQAQLRRYVRVSGPGESRLQPLISHVAFGFPIARMT